MSFWIYLDIVEESFLFPAMLFEENKIWVGISFLPEKLIEYLSIFFIHPVLASLSYFAIFSAEFKVFRA